MVSIPYPKPISTISDDSIINSNSWNQSILKHSGATGYPNNFKGADVKGILFSAGTGGVIGAGSGFIMNPSGVLVAMGQGSGLGAFTGAASSYAFTRYNNPDASNREIANNVIEGTIGGALTGLTTAAFTPIGSGVPGAILGAQNGLAVDLFVGAFSAKYDILNTPQTKNNKPQNNNESK